MRKAFTLPEILITLAIVGLLALAAVPQFWPPILGFLVGLVYVGFAYGHRPEPPPEAPPRAVPGATWVEKTTFRYIDEAGHEHILEGRRQ